MNATAIDCNPKPYRASLRERIRVWLKNLPHRKVGRGRNTLSEALQSDPSFAQVWQANIAMPIYDRTHSINWQGKSLTLAEGNELADVLMKHLFDVNPPKS